MVHRCSIIKLIKSLWYQIMEITRSFIVNGKFKVDHSWVLKREKIMPALKYEINHFPGQNISCGILKVQPDKIIQKIKEYVHFDHL